MESNDQTGNKADANVPPADAVKDDQNTKTNTDSDKVDRSEYLKLIAQRDEAKRELRELKGRASAAERTAAEKTGDVEALRASFAQEVADARAELETWKTRFHEKALKSVVLGELAKVSQDPDVAYLLLEKHFELVENNGDFVPRVKDSTASISEWAERKLSEMQKPHLLKSKRVGGTGDHVRGSASDSSYVEATELPVGFGSWSRKDQTDFFTKNPKLGAKITAARLRG